MSKNWRFQPTFCGKMSDKNLLDGLKFSLPPPLPALFSLKQHHCEEAHRLQSLRDVFNNEENKFFEVVVGRKKDHLVALTYEFHAQLWQAVLVFLVK